MSAVAGARFILFSVAAFATRRSIVTRNNQGRIVGRVGLAEVRTDEVCKGVNRLDIYQTRPLPTFPSLGGEDDFPNVDFHVYIREHVWFLQLLRRHDTRAFLWVFPLGMQPEVAANVPAQSGRGTSKDEMELTCLFTGSTSQGEQ